MTASITCLASTSNDSVTGDWKCRKCHNCVAKTWSDATIVPCPQEVALNYQGKNVVLNKYTCKALRLTYLDFDDNSTTFLSSILFNGEVSSLLRIVLKKE